MCLQRAFFAVEWKAQGVTNGRAQDGRPWINDSWNKENPEMCCPLHFMSLELYLTIMGLRGRHVRSLWANTWDVNIQGS